LSSGSGPWRPPFYESTIARADGNAYDFRHDVISKKECPSRNASERESSF
jgi:hypothetical protein